jgi:hypothetical protein
VSYEDGLLCRSPPSKCSYLIASLFINREFPIGQSKEFFELLRDLAEDADETRRECHEVKVNDSLQAPLRECGAFRLESSGHSHCNLLSNDLEFNANFVLYLNRSSSNADWCDPEVFLAQPSRSSVATILALDLRLYWPGLAMKREIAVNCPLAVAVAIYLCGTKANLAKFFTIQDLRPEHCGLNFCSVFFRGFGISNL